MLPTSFSLVITAAGILGVSVNAALEAYGNYFVRHVADQVSSGAGGGAAARPPPRPQQPPACLPAAPAARPFPLCCLPPSHLCIYNVSIRTQGYTKLLHVLGSNVAEFLQNLNNLHLHLSMGWPSMVAPAFRCEKVRRRQRRRQGWQKWAAADAVAGVVAAAEAEAAATLAVAAAVTGLLKE